MTQTATPLTASSATRLSLVGAGVVIAAPAVALAARLLLTPWYQDDSDRPDNVKYLSDVAASATSNDIGATLTLIGAVLFGAATVTVAALVRPTSPRLARVGEILGVFGAFGLAAYAFSAAVVSQASRVEDRDAMVALLDRMYDEPSTNMYYVAMVIGALGWLVLAFGLGRGRVVPKAAATIAGIGAAGMLLTTPGPIVSFVAGSAALALVGLLWVAVAAAKPR